MVVCFRCDARLKRRMDALVRQGGYEDYSELVAVAVDNLEAVHTKLGSQLSYVFLDSEDTELTTGSREVENFNNPDGSTSKPSSETPRPTRSSRNDTGVPAVFRLHETSAAAERIRSFLVGVEDTEGPGSRSRYPDPLPMSQWVFGQFNRLLPLVATTRALVQTLAESNGPIDLADASMAIATQALVLGEHLSAVDKELSIPRDLSYATALPHKTKGHQKAVLRFANQFVGEMTASGGLNGLPARYRFLAKARAGHNKIILTKPALEFALMENPVLDKGRFTGGERLSPQEAQFLIDHIINHVPAERQCFEFLIKAIQSGVSTPSRLDELVISNDNLMMSERRASDAFVSSQRSGAIARMCDLNLVKRHREGVKATYAVTDRGLAFLNPTQTLAEIQS